jgi:hypothetical protein
LCSSERDTAWGMMWRQREDCDREGRVSGETSVRVCVAVRGIQRGRMIWRQREECDREGRVSGETSVTILYSI